MDQFANQNLDRIFSLRQKRKSYYIVQQNETNLSKQILSNFKPLTRFFHAYELMLGLHVFRQTGPPRRVDCLAPPSVCHIKTEASR